MMRFTAVLFALMLSACTSMGFKTESQRIAASCAIATATLEVLTVANQEGKLSPSQQTQILNAVGLITPICTAPEPPTLDDVKLSAFTQAIAILQTRAAGL